MNGSSGKYKLDKKDFWSVLLIGLLVGASSTLAYLLENIHVLDLGQSTVFVVPIISITLTSLIRWLKDFTKQENKEGEQQ